MNTLDGKVPLHSFKLLDDFAADNAFQSFDQARRGNDNNMLVGIGPVGNPCLYSQWEEQVYTLCLAVYNAIGKNPAVTCWPTRIDDHPCMIFSATGDAGEVMLTIQESGYVDLPPDDARIGCANLHVVDMVDAWILISRLLETLGLPHAEEGQAVFRTTINHLKPDIQAAGSASVTTLMERIGETLNCHRSHHDRLDILVPEGMLHWKGIEEHQDRPWPTLAMRMEAAGTTLTIRVSLCNESCLSSLNIITTELNIQEARSSYEITGVTLCLEDARQLIISVLDGFHPWSIRIHTIDKRKSEDIMSEQSEMLMGEEV